VSGGRSSKKPTRKKKRMDRAQNGRRYAAGDTVKLKIVLYHRANLREIRAIFTHTHDKSTPPLIARGQPHPISDQGVDGSIRSRLNAEITLPRAVTPGVYELTRISYETAGGQLGHFEEGESLPGTPRINFEVVGEPADTPGVEDIGFADS
jgi:hypothetical protein